MTRLTELQRKSALIERYLRKNRMFPKTSSEKIHPLDEVTKAAFDKWLNGKTEHPDRLGNANKALVTHLRACKHEPGRGSTPNEDADLLGTTTGVMELGRILGLTRNECRRAIDTLAGKLAPTFSNFSLEQDQARSILSIYRGIYRCYRIENTIQAQTRSRRDHSVMSFVLSVRYAVGVASENGKELRRVRCKATIPSYRARPSTYEYDGYMTAPDGAGMLYWMFQERKGIERDMLMLIATELEEDRIDDANHQFILGMLITRTQDKTSRPAIWPVVLERIAELPKDGSKEDRFDDDIESLMTSANLGLHAPEEIAPWVFEKLKEASTHIWLMPDRVS